MSAPSDFPVTWSPAGFSERRGQELACTLCPHGCTLAPGQVGFCQVRRNRGGTLETATFSTSVEHLTSVERKPLYHYRPGLKVLTLAAPGCSFACHYCQNYRLSQYGRSSSAAGATHAVDVEATVGRAAAENAAIGLSYSEPSLAPELTLALADAGRRCGVEVLWKTNGFLEPRAARSLAPHIAAANIDVKSLCLRKHRSLTGADPRPVLEALKIFRDAGVWLEVSTPLIPKINTDRASLRAIAESIAAVDPRIPWHLVRFNPDYKMKRSVPTTNEQFAVARQIGHESGLEFVYVERAFGDEGRSTCCPECRSVVVERGIWKLSALHLDSGCCRRCAADIPGRWN